MTDLEREARRLYARYAEEVVEALGFCPWAERARTEGRVRVCVMPSGPDVGAVLAASDAIAGDPALEIGILLFPALRIPRLDFERFVATARQADTDRPHGQTVAMAMAAFHPDAEADVAAPHRFIPFVRRTPDPTIQLVRCSMLARVRAGTDHGTAFFDARSLDLAALLHGPAKAPIHERVAESNLGTARAMGIAAVAAIIADIQRDRDETYRRLGVL